MAKASAKKKWYSIVAPKAFNGRILGETPVLEAKSLVGRTLKVNLATITDDMKKQNTEISLVIEKVDGEKAQTSIIGYRLMPTSIKRFVRKGRSRIDETIKAITKDEKVVTIKIVLITQNVIKGSVKTALHTELTRLVHKKISQSNFAELSEQIIGVRLQRELKDKLKKIYPIKICDIRFFKYEQFIKTVDLRKIKENIARGAKKIAKIEDQQKEQEAEEIVEETEQQEAVVEKPAE